MFPMAARTHLCFDNIGWHGTKVVVYNLWQNDDGEPELDFDSDPEDIQLRGCPMPARTDTLAKQLTKQHISTRSRYSLRAYTSILYLHMPPNFQVILRGKPVQHLSIANDLKFPECILYKPQIGTTREHSVKEASVITTIGFAKEAPMISLHGFNVYHKNRLIMPFWKVFQENSSRGRGVVGVLEANFIEPAHDKQDFERTPMLQRLESRLKQMTIEYWNLHCHLIGYQPPKQVVRERMPSLTSSLPPPTSFSVHTNNTFIQNSASIPLSLTVPCSMDAVVDSRPTIFEAGLNHLKDRNGVAASAPSTPPQPGPDIDALPGQIEGISNTHNGNPQDSTCISGATIEKNLKKGMIINVKVEEQEPELQKRSADEAGLPSILEKAKRQQIIEVPGFTVTNQMVQAAVTGREVVCANLNEIMEENEQLRLRCTQYEHKEKELEIKITQLEKQLLDAQFKYRQLLQQQTVLKQPKLEN